MSPNREEYLTFFAQTALELTDRCRDLTQRCDYLEDQLARAASAVNNLDARLIVAERLLAKIKKMAEGEDYDETKQGWWN
jgi:predicted  nucleic acid-binding Zn-ribbon protein